MIIDFEYGNTAEGRAFLIRHPQFEQVLWNLAQVSNAGLGPRNVDSRLTDVCHRLSNTCRNDFLSIGFLAINGHGIAATQLLRSLYERSVTLAYIIKHPEKAERFVQYSAITEYRLIQEARKVFTDEQIDEAFKENSIEDIQKRFDEFKTPFLRKDGKKTMPNWDVDFASQVRDIGAPFVEFYLSAYLMPNSHIHATLTSIMLPEERLRAYVQADLTLMMAHVLFLKVVELHARVFQLDHDIAIEKCNQDFNDLWLKGLQED